MYKKQYTLYNTKVHVAQLQKLNMNTTDLEVFASICERL